MVEVKPATYTFTYHLRTTGERVTLTFYSAEAMFAAIRMIPIDAMGPDPTAGSRPPEPPARIDNQPAVIPGRPIVVHTPLGPMTPAEFIDAKNPTQPATQ